MPFFFLQPKTVSASLTSSAYFPAFFPLGFALTAAAASFLMYINCAFGKFQNLSFSIRAPFLGRPSPIFHFDSSILLISTDSFLSVFTIMGLLPVPGRSASGSARLFLRADDARSFLSIECALSRGIHLGLPSPGSRAQSPLISPSVPTRTQSPFLPLPNHLRRSSIRSLGSLLL